MIDFDVVTGPTPTGPAPELVPGKQRPLPLAKPAPSRVADRAADIPTSSDSGAKPAAPEAAIPRSPASR